MPIRILLADDHGILRAGLRNLLNAEPGLEVIGEAADGFQVLALAEQTCPDLILLYISMPNMGGIEVLDHLHKKMIPSRVLMLTVHEDESLLKKAIRAGASGYLVKRAAESELINAIKTVMQGDMYIHPSMTRALLKDPEAGPVVRGSGGVRKLRWSVSNKGKSGGVRVIYYIRDGDSFWMLTVYSKGELDPISGPMLKKIKEAMEDD